MVLERSSSVAFSSLNAFPGFILKLLLQWGGGCRGHRFAVRGPELKDTFRGSAVSPSATRRLGGGCRRDSLGCRDKRMGQKSSPLPAFPSFLQLNLGSLWVPTGKLGGIYIRMLLPASRSVKGFIGDHSAVGMCLWPCRIFGAGQFYRPEHPWVQPTCGGPVACWKLWS